MKVMSDLGLERWICAHLLQGLWRAPMPLQAGEESRGQQVPSAALRRTYVIPQPTESYQGPHKKRYTLISKKNPVYGLLLE